MRIIIGEDKLGMAFQLKAIVDFLGYEVVGVGQSKVEILELAENLKPDLVLLDIFLEQRYLGIDIGDILTRQLHIPFIYLITTPNKIIIDRILDTEFKGYILKPFKPMEVLMAIKIAITNSKIKNNRNYIFINRGLLKTKVALKKILFIKSDDNYIEIYTKRKIYIQRACLKQLFNKIASKGFIRVHRSYVVNKHYLKRLKSNMVEVGNFKVPVSRTYLKILKKQLLIIR